MCYDINMKIGVFDSGIGGLIVLKEIIKVLPKYNYLFLADTKNLPYGEKSKAQIYNLLKKSVDFLFKQDCKLIIVACNTASAQALRKIQQEYLPNNYPDRKILGVIRPTAEEVAEKIVLKNVLILGTKRTVYSKAYRKELLRANPKIKLLQKAVPKLAGLIEQNDLAGAERYLQIILKDVSKAHVDQIILACTHYSLLKEKVKSMFPRALIIAQEEFIGTKLKEYLRKHREIEKHLTRVGEFALLATKISPQMKNLSQEWFGKNIKLKLVKL